MTTMQTFSLTFLLNGDDRYDLQKTKETLEKLISHINLANGITDKSTFCRYKSDRHECIVEDLNSVLGWVDLILKNESI